MREVKAIVVLSGLLLVAALIWRYTDLKLDCYRKQEEMALRALSKAPQMKRELTLLKKLLESKRKGFFSNDKEAYLALLGVMDLLSSKGYVKRAVFSPVPTYPGMKKAYLLSVSFKAFRWSNLSDLLNILLSKKGFDFAFQEFSLRKGKAVLKLQIEPVVGGGSA